MINCTHCNQKNHNDIYKESTTCDVCIDLKIYRYFGYPTQERGSGSFRSINLYEQMYINEARKLGVEWIDQDCIKECYHYTRETNDPPDIMSRKVKDIIEKTLTELTN